MGIHFTATGDVYLHAYDDTHTKEILIPGTVFAINFTTDFFEYCLAALANHREDTKVDEIPKENYLKLDPAPVLKSAWATVICEVAEMPPQLPQRPQCRRREEPNIRAKILEKDLVRLPKIFNNRSFNLALESLILATRIPIYERYSKTYTDALHTYRVIKQKITDWRDMVRFQNGFDIIDNFLLKNGVHGPDVFGD